jgi:hypothetical protein
MIPMTAMQINPGPMPRVERIEGRERTPRPTFDLNMMMAVLIHPI